MDQYVNLITDVRRNGEHTRYVLANDPAVLTASMDIMVTTSQWFQDRLLFEHLEK